MVKIRVSYERPEELQKILKLLRPEVKHWRAAIRAGYSVDTAPVIGCENLSKPNIQEAIAKAMAGHSVNTAMEQGYQLLQKTTVQEAISAGDRFTELVKTCYWRSYHKGNGRAEQAQLHRPAARTHTMEGEMQNEVSCKPLFGDYQGEGD